MSGETTRPQPAAKPVGRRRARRQALFLLYQWDLTGQPLASLYEGEPDAFARELASAVAASAPALDTRISAVSDGWPAERLGTLERNVLRIGVYELEEETVPADVAINEAIVLAKRYATRGRRAAGQRDPGPDRQGARVTGGSEASLQRAEELLERLRVRVDALEASADAGGDVDEAVDGLAEIAELAKEIEAEVQRARQAADAGA